MSANRADDLGASGADKEPLIHLPQLVREVAVAAVLVLAAIHLLWPKLPIDVVFLGLLGFAAFLLLFDIESVEWLGIRARRRRIEKATEAVEAADLPTGTAEPPPPPDMRSISVYGTAKGSSGASASASVADRESFRDVPQHPLERLLWAYEQIRIELSIIAGNSGHLPRRVSWDRYSVSELARAVGQTGLMPDPLPGAIEEVRIARNQAVHQDVGSRLVVPAGRLAVDILEKLRQINRNYIRIVCPDLALYSDQGLTVPRTERGVMVEQLGPDGRVLHVHVFPREIEYTQGRFVSWEWNLERGVDGQTWYKDSASGDSVPTFSQAAIFAGREYPLEWRVEERVTQAGGL